MTAPSPAELLWRIGWLAGTAVPVPWVEPDPEPEPAWLQPPTLAELDVTPPRRYRRTPVDGFSWEHGPGDAGDDEGREVADALARLGEPTPFTHWRVG